MFMLVIECRRIGVAIRNRFGSGKDPIWLDTVNCSGKERSLTECGHNPWGQHDCTHNEDVAISCNQSLSVIRKSFYCLPKAVRYLHRPGSRQVAILAIKHGTTVA